MSKIQLQAIPHQTAAGLPYTHLQIRLTSPDGLIEPEDIKGLKLPQGIIPRQGVVLEGRSPTWLYGYLVHECHATAWVGCYDPRLEGAVVVETHTPQVAVGSVVPLTLPDVPLTNKSPCTAILIGGPPHSGKSVLCYALDRALKRDARKKNTFLQRAQWDGEGNWFAEMKNRPLAAELSKRSRRKGSENFFLYHANAVSALREEMELVLVDFGGRPKPEDIVLLHCCTHYILISSQPDKIDEWHDFCGRRGGLKPLAVIHSVREKRCEVLKNERFLEMIVGPWERGETLTVPDELLAAVLDS